MIDTDDRKEIVFPGDIVEKGELNMRNGVFRSVDGSYRSQFFGIVQKGEEFVDVVPFHGTYVPRRNDKVIGKIIDIGPFHPVSIHFHL